MYSENKQISVITNVIDLHLQQICSLVQTYLIQFNKKKLNLLLFLFIRNVYGPEKVELLNLTMMKKRNRGWIEHRFNLI